MSRNRGPLTAGRWLGWIATLAVICAACVVLGSTVGAGDVSVFKLWFGSEPLSAGDRAILMSVRLPRVLLAALLGGALSVAGVAFQALLRNPLADPYVLGVSGGASIGGVVALVLGLGGAGGVLGSAGIPLLAFAGALGALFLIEWIATVGGKLTVYTVLLTGAIFNAFSAALIYFIQSLASLEELHAIVFYLMGQIPFYSFEMLAVISAIVVTVVLMLGFMARDYNALSLGEDGARQIGVEVERVKRWTFVLGSLLTGLTVAVAGLIGFVGLVVPHVLRIVFGPDHRLLVPAAFFGGAAFLVLADLLARTLLVPNEMPIGVVTALIGGPFFLYLLRKRRGHHGF